MRPFSYSTENSGEPNSRCSECIPPRLYAVARRLADGSDEFQFVDGGCVESGRLCILRAFDFGVRVQRSGRRALRSQPRAK